MKCTSVAQDSAKAIGHQRTAAANPGWRDLGATLAVVLSRLAVRKNEELRVLFCEGTI